MLLAAVAARMAAIRPARRTTDPDCVFAIGAAKLLMRSDAAGRAERLWLIDGREGGSEPACMASAERAPDLAHDLMAEAYGRSHRRTPVDVALLAYALADAGWTRRDSDEVWSTDLSSAIAVAELTGGNRVAPLSPPPGLDVETLCFLDALGWSPVER